MYRFIGISIGDINGIGLEVILKSLESIAPYQACSPVIFAHQSLVQAQAKLFGITLDSIIETDIEHLEVGKINCVPLEAPLPEIQFGSLHKSAAVYAKESIRAATEGMLKGKVQALVTAPISKEGMKAAGFPFLGHTEYLASLCGKNAKPLMILANDSLRVALVSIHIPIREIPNYINQKHIFTIGKQFLESLRLDFGIQQPKIAVLGLNPHAGDGGVIGLEEIEQIEPAIRVLNQEETHFYGPFSADGFFGNQTFKNFDGVLAMYHDQGLIPFKTLAFHSGVNITANLPIVRTSPDHGTAFDIAGKGIANSESFTEAWQTALTILTNRGKNLS